MGALLLAFIGPAHAPATFALLVGAGLTGGLAQLFMTASLQSAPVAVVAPFDYLPIVGAVVFGRWLLHSPPSLSTLAGAGLIGASGLYTAWREHVGVGRAWSRPRRRRSDSGGYCWAWMEAALAI